MSIMVIKADQDGGRIQRNVRVAADNPLQCDWVAIGYCLSHPGVAGSKALCVELAFVSERLDDWGVAKGVARSHEIAVGVLGGVPLNGRSLAFRVEDEEA